MRRIGAFVFLTAICWAAAFAAEPKAPEAPRTFEDQMKYLEGALAESLRGEDWKMLELAADGLGKAKLPPDARELLLVRAERQAAFELLDSFSGSQPRARLETWGLATRALLGDKDSLEQLRVLATPAPAAPVPAVRTMAQYQEIQKQNLARQRREQAVLCLALLKDPGALAKVQACLDLLKQPKDPKMGVSYGASGGITSLVLAALVADPAEGWKMVLAFCGDAEAPMNERCSVLQATQSMCRSLTDARMKQTFGLVQQLQPKLPESAAQDLSKVYVGLVKSCDGKDFQSAQQMVQTTYYGMKLDADGVAALTDLRGRLTGPNSDYLRQTIDNALKQASAAGTPVKAVKPAPPPDGGGF